MGQEIEASRFRQADFDVFSSRLGDETRLLAQWLDEGAFAAGPPTAGFEMEVWLVGTDLAPAPIVEPFLRSLDDPLVVPELATFNAEINCPPRPLRDRAMRELAADLTNIWGRCELAANALEAHIAMFGILPTLAPEDLVMANMTPRKRYFALNDQIFGLRSGRPLTLAIDGRDHLRLRWQDVMLEAAATSFQIHLKVAPQSAHRVYNASKILSAPLIAISANSPYLFGRDLWQETRIPLFEQAVSVGGPILGERVNFGFRYAEHSIMETFNANLIRYPVLLPQLSDAPPEQLAHLRLHNGTIWRWNRPLIGFDEDGTPHIRIEHRVIPSGPTIVDAIANAALYYGAVHSLLTDPIPPEQRLPFKEARAAFYEAARFGIDAVIPWLDGNTRPVLDILRDDILPRAHSGLDALSIDPRDRDRFLDIVAGRIANRQTGATWQRRWVRRHGQDMRGLTRAYLNRQRTGTPVHEWKVE